MNDDQALVESHYQKLNVPPGWEIANTRFVSELNGEWWTCMYPVKGDSQSFPELFIQHCAFKKFRVGFGLLLDLEYSSPFDTVEAAVAYAEMLYL